MTETTEVIKRYQKSDKFKIVSKRYRQSDKGKATKQIYNQSETGKLMHKNADKKYHQSEKGKITKRINRTKRYAIRKRNFNWIPMFSNPFADSVKIDWHHITDAYVVAIPSELHQIYMGRFHREKVMEVVKQIY